MQIVEDRRHTSPSSVNLGCIEPAQVFAKVLIGGDAGGERRRGERCLVPDARNLTLLSGSTVASRAAECTDFRGFVSASFSFS